MENEDSLKSLFNSSHYPISWVVQRKELNVENIKSKYSNLSPPRY